MNETFSPVGEGKTTSMIQNDRRIVHTTYPNKSELVEEYEIQTNKLVVRKWRQPTFLGGEGEWVFEIGQATKVFNPYNDLLAPSNKNPQFYRADTNTHFVFRVRNVPWPQSNFTITIDEEEQKILIRTKNKKYYKKFGIPDLQRLKIDLDYRCMDISLINNTLIIKYQKPPQLRQVEQRRKQQISQIEANQKEEQPNCPQQ
eukprot:TRINITY_DN961_c0_g1_i1.p1 TRINITY_DN961_c0_g1~~TRINITY_DN961_c0_g1_i1.p1  ORF type:complete len:201 (-),score=42.14 TRINITY_DN961_c0_g1_i1:123-725(-)